MDFFLSSVDIIFALACDNKPPNGLSSVSLCVCPCAVGRSRTYFSAPARTLSWRHRPQWNSIALPGSTRFGSEVESAEAGQRGRGTNIFKHGCRGYRSDPQYSLRRMLASLKFLWNSLSKFKSHTKFLVSQAEMYVQNSICFLLKCQNGSSRNHVVITLTLGPLRLLIWISCITAILLYYRV